MSSAILTCICYYWDPLKTVGITELVSRCHVRVLINGNGENWQSFNNLITFIFFVKPRISPSLCIEVECK